VDHERFEILIEKRLQAATSPDESRELEAHLAECAACRKELEEDAKMDAVLKANAAIGAFSEKEWQTIEKRIGAQARNTNRPILLGMAMLAALLGVAGFFREGLELYPMSQLVMAVVWYEMARLPGRARTAMERKSRGENLALVEETRRQLGFNLGLGAVGAVGLGGYAAALFGGVAWRATDPAVRAGVGVLVTMLAAVFVALTVKGILDLRAFDRKAGE
jgi:anti-sigma factor RsiW